MLDEIRRDGLFATIEAGRFGGIKRSRTGGKGLKGVVKKHDEYFNPFIPLMKGEGA
jgi:beta-lysine 5,6-aminomutase alpha subunit